MFFWVLDMPDVLKQRGQDTPEIACRYNMDTQEAYHQEGLFRLVNLLVFAAVFILYSLKNYVT